MPDWNEKSFGSQRLSLQQVKSKAEAGNASAQVVLGTAYERGLLGAEQNYELAIRWYSLAADQESSLAQRALAKLFLAGKGTQRDCTRALTLFTKAAHQGDRFAMVYVADMYAQGLGTPQNYLLAAEWFKRAAHAHYFVAYIKLCKLYLFGLGVPKSYSIALFYLWKTVLAKPIILIVYPLRLCRGLLRKRWTD